MSDQRHIDDKLKGKWEDARFPVGDDMWMRISASLNKKKRRLVWLRWLSAASALLILGGFLIWLSNPSIQESQVEVKSKVITEHLPLKEDSSIEPGPSGRNGLGFLPNRENSPPSFDAKNKERTSELKPNCETRKSNDFIITDQGLSSMILPFKACEKCFEMPYPLIEMPALEQMDLYIPKVSPSQTPAHPNIFIGLHFNPASMLNGWGALSEKNGFINRRFNDVLNQSLAGKYLMNYGIETQVLFNNGLGVELGLDISKTEESYAYRYEINEFPVVDENVGIVAYLPLAPQDRISVNQQSSNQWLMVQLPVSVFYDKELSSKKFGWTAKLGVSPAILWRTEGYLPDETNLEMRNLTDKVQDGFHLAARLGVSLNYKPSARWRISTGPILTENISNLARAETALELKPRAIGWNLSTSFQLSR